MFGTGGSKLARVLRICRRLKRALPRGGVAETR
jgi:hypothetical protein